MLLRFATHSAAPQGCQVKSNLPREADALAAEGGDAKEKYDERHK
jgi:hypothetical protein